MSPEQTAGGRRIRNITIGILWACLLIPMAQAQVKTAFLPDYLPLDEKTYCRRTFEWTLGPAGQSHSQIIGRITVPYLTGPMSGPLVCSLTPGDSDIAGWYHDEQSAGPLLDGDHYPSSDCSLTAYPEVAKFRSVKDGDYIEPSAGIDPPPVVEVEKGLSPCQVGGDADDLMWIRIQDATVQGRLYKDAVIFWTFDNHPFQTVDYGGWDAKFGITPPTQAEARDRLPESFLIVGKGVGILAGGGIDSNSLKLASVAELISISCHDKAPQFDAFDVPGTRFTNGRGINSRGDVVGGYTLRSGEPTYGFLRDKKGNLTRIEYPGAVSTMARGINGQGDVVGEYADSAYASHGFLYSGGIFTAINNPAAIYTSAVAINNDRDIAGFYVDANNKSHGFLLRGGTYATIDFPGANDTRIMSINDDGAMVGFYRVLTGGIFGPWRGFLLKEGAWTQVDVPGALSTRARGINTRGDIVGVYSPPDGGPPLGFVLRKGSFKTIEVPCAQQGTALTGVNNRGEAVGEFADNHGISYAFTVRP